MGLQGYSQAKSGAMLKRADRDLKETDDLMQKSAEKEIRRDMARGVPEAVAAAAAAGAGKPVRLPHGMSPDARRRSGGLADGRRRRAAEDRGGHA